MAALRCTRVIWHAQQCRGTAPVWMHIKSTQRGTWSISSRKTRSVCRELTTMSLPQTLSSQDVTLPHIPELYNPSFLDVLVPNRDVESKSYEGTQASHPMIDALQASAHQTRTQNHSPAYDSTLSPTLDAFQTLRPWCFGADLDGILRKAWKEDAELTLRIIWNSRSIHDGKNDREVFYQAYGWLLKNHPRTAIQNLYLLVEPVCDIKKGQRAPHGYWKDLSNIVTLATLEQLGPLSEQSTYLHAPRMQRHRGPKTKKPQEIEKVEARQKRVSLTHHFHATLERRLLDPVFRALYIAVARLFANRLAKDVMILDELDALPQDANRFPLLSQVTLAGKWAPSPFASHDRVTNLSTAIAHLLFHEHALGPTLSITRDTPSSSLDTHKLRSFYQRWVLTPLRQALSCPEPLMSSNRWSDIIYTRVPSHCMKQNLPHFYKHDTERFEKYLEDVEGGTKTISGATLMPHELLLEAVACSFDALHVPDPRQPSVKDFRKKIADVKLRGIEAQWKTMVDRVREFGTLDNALAVCDVSGSMGTLLCPPTRGQPIEPIAPAVALSLLLSQIAKPPFNNGFITFSAEPKFVQLDPTLGLTECIKAMNMTYAGYNTDFNKIFLELLLPLAIKNNLRQEDMIKRLFVFSDMQFDEARNEHDSGEWETNHDVVEKAFKEAGYELPEIVYWNLVQGFSNTYPVTAEKKGVALMNGFSPAMLKVFLGEETAEVVEDGWEVVEEELAREKDQFDPISIMKKAVSKKSFDGLVVVD